MVQTTTADAGSKMERTIQEVVADVMHIASEKFLVSISSPLELTLVCHVNDLSKESLGRGIQSHISTLRSRGFEPSKFFVDPHKSLKSLKGAFPGVEIDDCGAGDHLDKVDSKIRQVKEKVRAVITGLPYHLGRERLKDLVTYTVIEVDGNIPDLVAQKIKTVIVRLTKTKW